MRVTNFAAAILLLTNCPGTSAQTGSPDSKPETPEYQLGESYLNYIRIKKCVEDRRGYLAIHISDAELDRARRAIKRIEDKLFPQVGLGWDGKPWTVDKMWKEANRITSPEGQMSRTGCLGEYHALMGRYQTLFPEGDVMKKDF